VFTVVKFIQKHDKNDGNSGCHGPHVVRGPFVVHPGLDDNCTVILGSLWTLLEWVRPFTGKMYLSYQTNSHNT